MLVTSISAPSAVCHVDCVIRVDAGVEARIAKSFAMIATGRIVLCAIDALAGRQAFHTVVISRSFSIVQCAMVALILC